MKLPRIRTILAGLMTFGVGWFLGVVWTAFQTGYSELMSKQADDLKAARVAKGEARDRHPTYVPLPHDPNRVDRLKGRLS